MKKPLLFCFCGPSGSGKSTICRELLKRVPSLMLSISSTTRSARKGEQDGRDYYFIGRNTFEEELADKFFLEHAEYSGNLYGTGRKNLDDALSSGKDLVLDIEVQGVTQLKRVLPECVITIFVCPPSMTSLEQRLERRGEAREQMLLRLKRAKEEIQILTTPGFSGYFLINDKLESAVACACSIVEAERARFPYLYPTQEEFNRFFG